jgi:hypothetical protein
MTEKMPYDPMGEIEGDSKIKDPDLAILGAEKSDKKRQQGKIQDALDLASEEYSFGRSDRQIKADVRDMEENEVMAKEIYKRAYNDATSRGKSEREAKDIAAEARDNFRNKLNAAQQKRTGAEVYETQNEIHGEDSQ